MSLLAGQIERRLASLDLPEPARYSLLAGGKRLRPLLVLETTKQLGGDPDLALDPACALELIHTYSLVHDDLPCMDDDDLRRGQPSCHRAFSEWEAVLAGDALLTYAFELITGCALSDKKKVQVIQLLAHRSGHRGMIGGQRLDLAQSLDVKQTHLLKTGALFAAAFEMGGIISDAPDPLLATLGLTYGHAFQLRDDIIDGDGQAGSAVELQEVEARLQRLLKQCNIVLS